MTRAIPVIAGLAGVVVAVCAMAIAAGQAPGDSTGMFEGSWSASGERHTLEVEDGRVAVILRLSGSLALETSGGLARGFRAEAIAFDDGRGAGAGRAVWTDDRGERIFSDLAGQAAQSGRRLSGTFTGGTGRYAGITGSYAFSWRYVTPADDGRIHAAAVAVTGRFAMGGGR